MEESGEINSGVSIKQKDSRELLGQIKEVSGELEAEKIAQQTGYDNENVRKTLINIAGEDSKEYDYFVRNLRREIQKNEKEVKETFDNFLQEHPETDESRQRKEELKRRVIRPNNEQSAELVTEIQEMFPSGNFLVHGTSVEGGLRVAGDSDGSLKSVAEIRKKDEKFRGKGGFLGISLSYNGVGALPGTWRHMAMFVTSPEQALSEETKLVVPYYAANKELQLVGKAYDKNMASYVESTMDFMGFSTLFGRGVISDFVEFNDPYNHPKGESPLERDLAKVRSSEIKPEDISSKYQVGEGKFIVDPTATESEITEGIIYSDYLLKYSDEGRALGKTLSEVTAEELSKLEKSVQKTVGRSIYKDAERAAEILEASTAVSLPVENTVMFIPDADLDRWLDVFSRTGKAPRTFITFSSTEGPKVPNWKLPEGDWNKAEGVISNQLGKFGVAEPSVPFNQLIGRDVIEKDIIGNVIKHLKWEVVSGSKEMVLDKERKLSFQ